MAKSKYSPGPTPKSGTVTFSAAGQAVKAVVDLVGTDGSNIDWEDTATLDGKPAPVTGNPDGDVVMAKRTNPNTIENVGTRLRANRPPSTPAWCRPTAKTLTVTSAGTERAGTEGQQPSGV